MPEPTPRPPSDPAPAADPPYHDVPVTYGSLALAPRPDGARWRPRGPATWPDERRLRGLAQALAEVLAGRRPPQTVQGRLSERAYRELLKAGKMIDAERPPLVGRPHVQRPRDGVVEMCLLVRCGERSRALALRLERFGVVWLVTEFETA